MLPISSQRKYNIYHQDTLLDIFKRSLQSIIGRMVIPLLANDDLTPMLDTYGLNFLQVVVFLLTLYSIARQKICSRRHTRDAAF